MNPFFTLLSSAYIFFIFYLAGSPIVSRIGEFNFYSLLHIPLYAILMIFLLLALASKPETNRPSRHLIAAWIAIAVAAADEYYQSYIPLREASMGDLLLDILGVGSAMILARRTPPLLWVDVLKKLKK